jgi:hypothetical protein
VRDHLSPVRHDESCDAMFQVPRVIKKSRPFRKTSCDDGGV